MLFWALVVLVVGSLLGELLGIHQVFGQLWSWFGHQGWEFLELGRVLADHSGLSDSASGYGSYTGSSHRP